MKDIILLLSLVFFPALASAQRTSPAGGAGEEIVGVAPLDMQRVEQIAALLPDKPAGFGDPYHKREVWDALKAGGNYDRIIRVADNFTTETFPEFDEPLYMRMFTNGDSQSGKDLLTGRLRWLIALTWAECLENDGKYLPKIEEVIAGLLGQKTWVNPRNYLERNYDGLVELSTASYGQNLGQALYLLDDKLSPATRLRVKEALNKRMFEPILATLNGENQDHGWLKVTNNWNAVCLSGIAGTALTVLDDKKERAKFVAIAERYHRNFIAGFLDDGYCTEGISYYNYGFGRFVTLREIVYRSTSGKLDFFADEKMGKIAAFGINSEIINGTYPAIADCKTGSSPSRAIMWYASRNLGIPSVRYGATHPGGTTADLVAEVMYVFPNTASAVDLAYADAEEKLPVRSFFDAAGILTVRPLRSADHGLGAVFKGGRNNEHHNHNDVGSYSLAAGSEIMAGDPGSIPYTAKTFGPERYTYKSLGSYGHPVPLVAGKEQAAGKDAFAEIVSTRFTDERDKVVMELASAYEVPGLKSLKRTFSYDRGVEKLEVLDEVRFDTPQEFDTPVITKSDWKKIADNRLELSKGAEKVLVVIDAFGTPYELYSEKIAEEGGEPYQRIAVRMTRPVKEARVKLTYTVLK